MEGNIPCLIFNISATRQEASRLLQYALPILTAVVFLPMPNLILFLVETFPTPQTTRTHVRTRGDRAVAAQCGGLRRRGAHRSVFVVTTSPPTDASPHGKAPGRRQQRSFMAHPSNWPREKCGEPEPRPTSLRTPTVPVARREKDAVA